MALIKEFNYEAVTGARFGKYNLADNSSAVIYQLDNILIDSGPPNQKKEVINYLENKKFNKLILTHHHEDHSGNASVISQKFDVPVYVHENGILPLKKGFTLKMYQQIFWGKGKNCTAKPVDDFIHSDNGFTLEPIYTPGHCDDHLCFLERKMKWLFTGDLFLSVKPKLFRLDENLNLQIKSLEKILEYDFEIIFCSHRGALENGHDLIKKKLLYFKEIIEKVNFLKSKGLNKKNIVKTVLGKKSFEELISFGHLSKKNFINECVNYEED